MSRIVIALGGNALGKTPGEQLSLLSNVAKIIVELIKDGNEKIDEVLVSVMLAPKTFTREDVVEINCHGGIATTNKVLELLLNNGARLAEPGEFTKRAFLNGRIDLLEAEATMDLISSKSETARKISINTLTGETSNLIKSLRSDLVQIISNNTALLCA